jgi:hypothetical protein
MINDIVKRGDPVRIYTQNIDGFEVRCPWLSDEPLPGTKNPFSDRVAVGETHQQHRMLKMQASITSLAEEPTNPLLRAALFLFRVTTRSAVYTHTPGMQLRLDPLSTESWVDMVLWLSEYTETPSFSALSYGSATHQSGGGADGTLGSQMGCFWYAEDTTQLRDHITLS